MNKKLFALIGAAGYIAPRHMKAIYETNNILKAAVDPNDSVGILDKYFPDCKFFTNFEKFTLFLKNKKIDFISVCSPNYLHSYHCIVGLENNCNIICEKPLVLNPKDLDELEKIEVETGKRIYTILQLRLHQELISLKKSLTNNYHIVNLKYITPRGPWYNVSWKGYIEKSGGLLMNIGIHLFDLMIWLFGNEINTIINVNKNNKIGGISYFENAEISWFLSIDKNDLIENNNGPYRSLIIDSKKVNFDKSFTELHTKVYRNIIDDPNSFSIKEVRPAIELVCNLNKKFKLGL